jgi:hypothetical protein
MSIARRVYGEDKFPYVVLNGDGLQVGEYQTLEHANGAARDMARAARRGGDKSNFYTVTDRNGEDVPGGKTYYADPAK